MGRILLPTVRFAILEAIILLKKKFNTPLISSRGEYDGCLRIAETSGLSVIYSCPALYSKFVNAADRDHYKYLLDEGVNYIFGRFCACEDDVPTVNYQCRPANMDYGAVN